MELTSAAPHAQAAGQPLPYPPRREYVEPDWNRIPGYRGVSVADWESATWQRKHTVKNLRELKAALGEHLPDWSFRVPTGGLSLWCELPGPGRGLGVALAAAAERRGVVVAPGPVFAPDGGLDRFVRLPFTRRVEELSVAVRLLAEAWAEVAGSRGPRRPEPRVMVA